MEDFKHVPGFLSPELSQFYFNILTSEKTAIVWHDVLKADDGTLVPIKRKMAYCSDYPGDYKYANLSFPGQGWLLLLKAIQLRLEIKTKYQFNSVLLNYYQDGKDVIKWHSDKEESLGDNPVIATVNLGARRTFQLRNIETKEVHSFQLNNGDLFLMLEDCQRKFVHQIPKEPLVTEPRISLTYRLNHHDNKSS